MVDDPKGRGGRPPKGPISGKGATLATRITAETRRALDEEAARTGRSVSQVVEIWLDEARNGRAQYHQLLGGSVQLAAAIEALVKIARRIQAELPEEARTAALRAGWHRAINRLLPADSNTANAHTEFGQIEKLGAIASAWKACRNVLTVLENEGDTDPVFIRATQPLRTEGGALTSRLIEHRLADVLQPPNNGPFDRFSPPDANVHIALTELRAAGTTARKEIDEAIELVVTVMVKKMKPEGLDLANTLRGEAIAEIVLGHSL